MLIEFYTSAFCEPCMQTRVVVAEAERLVPGAEVVEYDVVRDSGAAAAEGITSTPTVIVRGKDGAEAYRASGVPSLPQLLVAAAKAL